MFRKASVGLFLLLLVAGAAVAGQPGIQNATPALVDINSAPLQEIEAVVMDDLLAKKIVDNRPYANKRQLLTRRLVTMEEYERIQSRIVARRPRNPE